MRVFKCTSDLGPFPEAEHEDPRHTPVTPVMGAILGQRHEGAQMPPQLCAAAHVRDIRAQVTASTESPDIDLYTGKENEGPGGDIGAQLGTINYHFTLGACTGSET